MDGLPQELSQQVTAEPTFPDEFTMAKQANTGPKGVLADYKRHQALQKLEKLAEEQSKWLELNSKGLSSGWMERQVALETLEFRGLLDQEQTLVNQMFIFGQLIEIDSSDSFLSQVDNENPSVTVFIHWIHPELPLCKSLNKHFYSLARKYPTHKWCFANVDTIPGSELDAIAYPAIFCYKGGELVHTALRYVDQIRTWNGMNCELEDIEDILIKAQLLKEEDIALGQ